MSENEELERIEVQMGSHNIVEIDKLFGPAIFAGLRIYCSTTSCEWVIERQVYIPGDYSKDDQETSRELWVEWCRIPAQYKWEFHDDE